MEKLTFNHIGMAVDNISEAIAEMNKIAFVTVVSKRIVDDKQSATLQMVLWMGLKIELVSGAIVQRLVDKGIRQYHFAYGCYGLDSAILDMKERGFMQMGVMKVAKLFDGGRVAFFYSDKIGIIELVEMK